MDHLLGRMHPLNGTENLKLEVVLLLLLWYIQFVNSFSLVHFLPPSNEPIRQNMCHAHSLIPQCYSCFF